MFTTVVVGRGLFGVAAAKYLARNHAVLAIGPSAFDTAQGMYSSHNDQGRVVRRIGFDDYWTELNTEADRGFRALEEETGIKCIHRSGCITACSYPQSKYFKEGRVSAMARKAELDVQIHHGSRAVGEFLALKGFSSSMGAENACMEAESSGAGYLNIPLLKAAQEASFFRHGGRLNESIALGIKGRTPARVLFGKSEPRYDVLLADGSTVHARNVVMCGGSFSNKFNLLPTVLPLQLKTETVLLAQLHPHIASTLSSMPSLLWEVDTGAYEGVYVVPPMLYPDGNWYLKVGCNTPHDVYFEANDNVAMWAAISRWFEGDGNTQKQEDILKSAFRTVFPDTPVLRFEPKRCIITRTNTGRPLLSKLDEGLFVATGGNGYGAMCSDAIGRRTATMILGRDPLAPHTESRACYF